MVVPSVEHIGEGPVPGLVLVHICIEQIDRNDMSGRTSYAIPPGPDLDRATLDFDRGLLVDQVREVIDRPRDRLLSLQTVPIQPLKEVPAAVQQGHRHHRHVEIRSRANRVAGEHTKPARIGRHPGLKPDLHGKIRDARWLSHRWSPQWSRFRRIAERDRLRSSTLTFFALADFFQHPANSRSHEFSRSVGT